MMRTLLLVDDDEDDRILFQEAVSVLDKSIQCWTATDGQHALQILSYDLVVLPDLIFLDLNMPRMNGLEFLHAIKGNRSLRSIPVIIYSTSCNPNDIAQAKNLGALDFLTKPSDFNDLYSKLIHVLNRHLKSQNHMARH
jgi:CheY-like chemotaxis protein